MVARKDARLAKERVVLRSFLDHPEWSYAQIAWHAGWVGLDGKPMKVRVQRAVRTLVEAQMLMQLRKGGRWELTLKGENSAKAINQW